MQALHDWFVQTDFAMWYKLHATWRSGILDATMPFVRNQFFWVPLYMFLAVYMPVNYRRQGIFWCVLFILCFAFGDFISAHLVKPFFHRTRPCNDPRLAKALHLIVERSSGYSFPSSHAANHFALGTFMAATLGGRNTWVIFAALLWATLVAYAQVYVGVHFPMDVIGGGLIGVVIGLLMAVVYRKVDVSKRKSISNEDNFTTDANASRAASLVQ